MLSVILCNEPYTFPGAPSRLAYATLVAQQREMSLQDSTGPDLTVLALNVLGTFDFSSYALHELIRKCAIMYLEDENADIRKAASTTCCQLLIQDPICQEKGVHAVQVVHEVLGKLMSVAVSDPGKQLFKL